MLKIKPDWMIVCKNQFHFWLVQPCYGLITELQFDLTRQTGFYWVAAGIQAVHNKWKPSHQKRKKQAQACICHYYYFYCGLNIYTVVVRFRKRSDTCATQSVFILIPTLWVITVYGSSKYFELVTIFSARQVSHRRRNRWHGMEQFGCVCCASEGVSTRGQLPQVDNLPTMHRHTWCFPVCSIFLSSSVKLWGKVM